MPDIVLRGTVSRNDLLRFQYFHIMRLIWPLEILTVTLTLVMVPAILLSDRMSFWKEGLEFSPFVLWTLMMNALPWWTGARQYKTQAYLREPVRYTFSGDGVSAAGESSSWTMAWENLKRVRETKTLFVLYHGANVGVLVPKHFFESAEQMAQWRALVDASAPQSKIQKPGWLAALF